MKLTSESLKLLPKMESGVVEGDRSSIVTTNIHFTSMIQVSTLLVDRAQSVEGLGRVVGNQASKALTAAMMEYIKENDPQLVYSEAMTLLMTDNMMSPPGRLQERVF